MWCPPTGDGDPEVAACGTTHTLDPVPECGQPLCPTWFAGSEVRSGSWRTFSRSSCSHRTPCSSPRLCVSREGGQGKAGPAAATWFWARVIRVGCSSSSSSSSSTATCEFRVWGLGTGDWDWGLGSRVNERGWSGKILNNFGDVHLTPLYGHGDRVICWISGGLGLEYRVPAVAAHG